MGMYTELVLKCVVPASAPQDVKTIVTYLFQDRDTVLPELPNHEFFQCSRWDAIGISNSFYHHPEVVNSIPSFEFSNDIHIFSRSDLKDYDNEIMKFIDWLTPYLGLPEGTCVGWSWYEEENVPTLIVTGEKPQ